MSDRETKLHTLSVILEALNRHDLDAIMDCFADDCVFESPRGPYPWGRCLGVARRAVVRRRTSCRVAARGWNPRARSIKHAEPG